MCSRTLFFAGLAVATVSACAQPQPVPVGPEPISDKYGALHCPVGFVLQGDSCIAIAPTVPPVGPNPPPAPAPGPNQNTNQNQNQNQNQNTNQNTNQNQNQNQNT
jgi:hypothetical protein